MRSRRMQQRTDHGNPSTHPVYRNETDLPGALDQDCKSEPGRRCLTVQVQGESDYKMTEGKPVPARYHITLRKCIDGQNPVITTYLISEKTYHICQGLIHDKKGGRK